MRTNPWVTTLALVISFGWAVLLGVNVLRDSRANAWYDMDFSLWMVCVLYAFVHLFIGKLWALSMLPLIRILRRRRAVDFEPFWTEDAQLVFASLWPVGVPLAALAFLAFLLGNRKNARAGDQLK